MTTDDRGNIVSLAIGEVIVVGTNRDGHHAGGAAAYAHERFGLVWRCDEGLSGQTYALPTMDGLNALGEAAARFLRFARFNPYLRFYLTRVGCGIAGHADKDVAPFFKDAPINVVLPDGWIEYKLVPVDEAEAAE